MLRRRNRLRGVVDVLRDVVAESIVRAVQRDRRHVRTRKRSALVSLLAESPRRISELVLTGVPPGFAAVVAPQLRNITAESAFVRRRR